MTDVLLGREERLTFKANLRQTRYGWLRLTPAYSVHLVREILDHYASPAKLVLDPYCGTGTTSLACAEKGIPSVTTDINPLLIWLAKAKSACYSPAHVDEFQQAGGRVATAISATSEVPEWLPAIHQIEKWWDERTLHALGRAMAAVSRQGAALSSQASDLLRAAFCRVLIE